MSARPTPLAAVGSGLAAGLIGTGLMTVAQELSTRLRSSQDPGGQQSGADPWDTASAPAKVAKRIAEGVFHREVSPDRIPLLTHAMHWGYGTAWAAAYGLIQGTFRGPPVGAGLLFGMGVWTMSYVQLVPMGLYEPPWKYPLKELVLDLSYHLAYGAGLAAAYAALDRR